MFDGNLKTETICFTTWIQFINTACYDFPLFYSCWRVKIQFSSFISFILLLYYWLKVDLLGAIFLSQMFFFSLLVMNTKELSQWYVTNDLYISQLTIVAYNMNFSDVTLMEITWHFFFSIVVYMCIAWHWYSSRSTLQKLFSTELLESSSTRFRIRRNIWRLVI